MTLQKILNNSEELRYRLLSRLQTDCLYYLGNGHKSAKILWAGNEIKHINYMKEIYASFGDDKKPEWINLDDILDFEKKMTGKGLDAVIIELDYKGCYERYALTLDEFNEELSECFKRGMEVPSTDGMSFTTRPMVHLWYKAAQIGDENWNRFFTDMEYGLPESDIESGNLAYIEFGHAKSLRKYMSQIAEYEPESVSKKEAATLDEKVEKAVSLQQKIKAKENLEISR